jgi:hypothetical protein
MVVSETGLEQELGDRGIAFVDLNRDELVRARTKADYSGCAASAGSGERALSLR